jgi:hypothetical protein
MRRKEVFLAVVVSIVLSLLCCGYAQAGVATVSGKVTEANGVTPVVGAEVTIRVTGLSGIPDFPWPAKKVYTDIQGNYQASVRFPGIVEIGFYVTAFKTDTLPFKSGAASKEFLDSPPVNSASYKINVKMSNRSDCAQLEGVITDMETGLPLSDGDVMITVPGITGTQSVFTDSDGSYKLLVRVGSVPQVVTIKSPGFGHEVKYLVKQYKMTLANQNKYSLNIALMRDKQAGNIHGTVINANTGNPIAYAKVRISGPGGWPVGTPVTDSLGRYKQSLYGNQTAQYGVSTYGAHTLVQSRSRYTYNSKGVVVGVGQTKRVDFEMIPK